MTKSIKYISKEIKSFKCDVCPDGFNKKCQLIIHKKSVHEGKKLLRCEFCSHVFALQGDFNRHIKSIQKEENNSFECDICFVSFAQKCVLLKHKKVVHVGNKSFKCQICLATFSQNDYVFAMIVNY